MAERQAHNLLKAHRHTRTLNKLNVYLYFSRIRSCYVAKHFLYMSDTSYTAVSACIDALQVDDDDWIVDCLSDDGKAFACTMLQ